MPPVKERPAEEMERERPVRDVNHITARTITASSTALPTDAAAHVAILHKATKDAYQSSDEPHPGDTAAINAAISNIREIPKSAATENKATNHDIIQATKGKTRGTQDNLTWKQMTHCMSIESSRCTQQGKEDNQRYCLCN
jgi:hypothetical protein